VKNKNNRKLTVAFAALCALNLFYLVIGFLSIPAYYHRTTTLTIVRYEIPGANYPTNLSVQQSATEKGLNLAQFAVEQIAFHSAFVLLCMAVAVVIVLRARWNWFAWYSAFFLFFIAGFAFYEETYVAHLMPLWVSAAGSLFWPLILLYFYLFPNGQPAPRQALWVIGPWIIFHFFVQLLGVLSLIIGITAFGLLLETMAPLAQALVFFVFLFILATHVYRYWRIFTREERQQTKWFLLGLAFFIGLSLVSESLGNKNPYRSEIGLLIFAFVPLSVGVALLRYRLWDIDILIRRTLVYSVLTVTLALVYFGSVILLQGLFQTLTGQNLSQVVTVISTLAIAALFPPLRRRIQSDIDRRFYRKKYNAEQALEAFARTVRQEVDLDEISESLLRLVVEAMQPEGASLWLIRNSGAHSHKPGEGQEAGWQDA
jgi:hypothetical protein